MQIPALLLDSYAGNYQLPGDRVVAITRKGDLLWAKAGADELEFVPIDQTTFYGAKFNMWVTFSRDSEGKVAGFTGHQPGSGDFEAMRL